MSYQPGTTPTTPGTRSGAPVLSIVSFVLSAIALVFIPILFGGAAIACAAVAMNRKERLGKIALVVAIIATIAGIAIGAYIGVQMVNNA